MILHMFKIMAHYRAQAFGQWRVVRRSEKVSEPLLHSVSRGYALPDTHEFSATGPSGEHRIFVFVPPGSPPPSGYPLLFVVDANAIFGAAVDAARLQMPWPDVSGVTPFMIVGVGYPGSTPFDHRRRSWDLAPSLRNPTWKSPLGLPWHQPGGADDFIDFLTGPLLNALCARYPVARARRGICGLSLGGTFALYAFAIRHDAFSFHAAVSSALWFDGGRIVEELKALSPGSRLTASAFICVGKEEIPDNSEICDMMLAGSRDAAKEIERTGSPVTYRECEGENHQSTIIAMMPQLMKHASRHL